MAIRVKLAYLQSLEALDRRDELDRQFSDQVSNVRPIAKRKRNGRRLMSEFGVALVDGFILNALLERTAPKAAQQTRLAENITQPFKTFPV